MRSRVFCVLLGLAMGWTIAGVPAGAASEHREERKPKMPPYTTQRVIAVQKGTGSCPPVPGWEKGESLRDLAERRAHEGGAQTYGRDQVQANKRQGKKSRKLEDLLHKYSLDRFCVYRSKGSEKFPDPKSVGLEKANPDRMALTPTAPADLGAIGNQTWPELADRFLDQVGKVRLAPATTPDVRLVFVDTHPTGEGLPASPVPSAAAGYYPSWHGHAMAHLGHEIVCGHGAASGNCPIQVATRLAFRYDTYEPEMSFSPDPGSEGGGHLGLVGDLAVAILAELDNWQANYPDTRLILNLSVGWDGEYKDLDAKRLAALEASSQAVYKALSVAAHLGVLVIGSAGNRTGGEDSTSPLLPAAWELKRPSWLPLPFHKTIYAVGGVDWQGLPLPNSRKGGRPWRVAYGDHAVARTRAPGPVGIRAEEPTKMYTGTSVSTVVVSSIAAVAWHLRPDLKPAQVMRRIGHAGEVLPGRADFYAWAPIPWLKPHTKRLSLCQTVLRMCGPGPGFCGPKLERFDCRLARHPAADFIDIVPKNPTIVGFTPMDPAPSCDSKTRAFQGLNGPLSDTYGCPMEKLLDITVPYKVSTQPPENPCPSCTAVPDPPRITALSFTPGLLRSRDSGAQSYGLAVGLDPDWLRQARNHGTRLRSAILVVDCTDPERKERFDITSVVRPLYDAANYGVDSVRLSFGNIGIRKSLAGCTASVDFMLSLTVDGTETERSVQSPIYVDP